MPQRSRSRNQNERIRYDSHPAGRPSETDRILSYYVQQDAERRRRSAQGNHPESKRPAGDRDRKAQSPQAKRKAAKNAAAQKSRREAVRRNEAKKNAAIRNAQRRKDQAAGKGERQNAAQPSLALTRALVAFIIIAVLGLGCSLLYMAPIFPVKEITVEGAKHLTKGEVLEMAAIPEGSTMLRVGAGSVERRLEESPWIESANVTRELPGTLKIEVKEPDMAAVVDIVSKETKRDERWAMDDECNWLMLIPPEGSDEAEGVPASVYSDMENVYTISDVPIGPAPVAGAKCTDASILNAFEIVSNMSTPLADQVIQVSAADDRSATLILEDGIEVSFGDASDIRTKERICLQLMEEYPGQIAYINVRVVDRPTWRSY